MNTNTVKYMVGLNMKCNKVVCKVVILEEHADDTIIVQSGGIKIILNKNDQFFDTRKECKAFINK